MKAFFKELGAPLLNPYWSWGAVREQDKTIFLRVWLDGTNKLTELDGRYYSWVSQAADNDQSLGAAERRKHVDLIRNNGYRALMVMCIAIDDEAPTRTIREWDAKEIRVGGKIVEINDNLLLENVGRISTFEAKQVK